MKSPKQITLLTAVLLSVCASSATWVAPAAAQEIAPEVSSRVWQSDSAEFGSVCLNGKEVVAFQSGLGDGVAGEKADELAIKLSDLLNDKTFDAEDLMPGKDGNLSVLKVSTNSVLSFETQGLQSIDQNEKAPAGALEASFRVVNAIRTAYNAPVLPASLLKFTDRLDQGRGNGSTQGAGSTISNVPPSFSGKASWYGGRFHGRRTSDGSRYDQEQLTAAHRSLPFGTRLLVMNRRTGQTCVVRVNDRGPFVGNRVIDLSKGAARELKMLSSGVAMVDCLVIGNSQVR